MLPPFPMAGGQGRFPLATAIVLTLTLLGNALQLFFPAVNTALRRDPVQLQAGQWWRFLTPLFVQSGGLWAFGFVTMGLALIGFLVERFYGSGRWLLLYGGSALIGELAGYAWDPHDSGGSVAVAGLISGLLLVVFAQPALVTAIRQRHAPLVFLGVLYSMGFIGGLVGSELGNFVLAIVVSAVVASGLIWLLQFPVPARGIGIYLGLVALGGSLILTLRQNLHGPPILVGLLLGGGLWLIGLKSASASRTDRSARAERAS